MRKLLLSSLVSLAAIGMSGCEFVPGFNNGAFKLNGTVVGEMHAQSGGANGVLVTLYPNITEGAIRTMHDTGRPRLTATIRRMRGIASASRKGETRARCAGWTRSTGPPSGSGRPPTRRAATSTMR